MKKERVLLILVLGLGFVFSAGVAYAQTLPTYRRFNLPPQPRSVVRVPPIVIRVSPRPTPSPLPAVCTQANVTFAKLRTDVDTLRQSGDVKDTGVQLYLKMQIQIAEDEALKGNAEGAKTVLGKFKEFVNWSYNNRTITQTGALLLLDDAGCLITSLTQGSGV